MSYKRLPYRVVHLDIHFLSFPFLSFSLHLFTYQSFHHLLEHQ